MSALSQRTICKTISASNARRAVARIEKELEMLAKNSPAGWGDGLSRDEAVNRAVRAKTGVRGILKLWERT